MIVLFDLVAANPFERIGGTSNKNAITVQ